jgi:hypothetical protein
VGYPVSVEAVATAHLGGPTARYDLIPIAHLYGQLVHVVGIHDGRAVLGTTPVPWLPVFLMVMREVVAGALRAMTATRGLVLAARASGKVKAWAQGVTIISLFAFPACFWNRAEWHLHFGFAMTWLCAAISLYSIAEYIWVNRAVLKALVARKAV